MKQNCDELHVLIGLIGCKILRFLNDLWNIARSGKTFSALEIIPLSTFLGGKKNFGDHFFIRECYLEMKRVIADHFTVDPETLTTLGQEESDNPFILTGTPGIGKSCFAYYLLMELLRSKERIVYQVGPKYWYSDGGEWSEILHKNPFVVLLAHFRGWYICDLYHGRADYAITNLAKTIIISSPRVKPIKVLLNNCVAQRYFLPVWSDEEMSMFIKMHIGRMDEQQAARTIEDWGNVPRYLVMKPSDTLDEIIRTTGSLSSLQDRMYVAMNQDLGMPSKLIHLFPSSDFKTITPRICSKKAETKIFDRIIINDWHSLVEQAFSAAESPFEVAAGQVFEYVAHELLKKGGKYTLHSLQSNNGNGDMCEELKLETSQSYIEFATKQDEMETWAINLNAYCKPKSKNFPCLDALSLKQSGVLYIFQITRADSHPIKFGPLCKILQALRAKNRFHRICFVFVLPAAYKGLPNWTRGQVFTYEGKEPSEENLQQLCNFTQYIMFLSKEDALRLRDRKISEMSSASMPEVTGLVSDTVVKST